MNEVFDFVVVGSGGGSMCAALVLRKAGKSVLILEKTDLVGGSTAKAGGVMWVPNNRFMQAQGVEDSHEKATAYLDAVVGDHADAPGATRERRQTYLREAPEMVDFLVGEGIKLRRSPYWPDYYDDRAGGSAPGRTVVAELFDVNELGPWKSKLRPNAFPLPAPIFEAVSLPLFKVSWRGKWVMLKTGLRGFIAKLTGKHWVTAGAALQGRMLKAALKAGVEIRTEAPVTELILNGGGAVAGVVTEKDGREWRVGARSGVLLNAGGFAHNQQMLDKYIPNVRAEWTHAAPGDTGDMHRELMRIGAQMAQMEEMVGNQMTLPPGLGPQGVQMQLAKPHAFLVDQSGERYMNEGGSYMEFCQRMLARHEKVPAVPSWWIMDSQYIERHMLANTMPGAKKPAAWFLEGYLRKADTLDGLATACGIDPRTLKATTERFNGFARQGRDDDFHRGARAYDRWLGDPTQKPNAALGTVEKGPFYAVTVVPGNVGTFGGVVTDAYARVLREDGSVIGGLYATGTTTAAVMGRTYPGAGCSIGPAFTFGYVAAKHAANLGNRPA
ncbi:FAD-dependent oxidoreductase [Phenylobacterium sp. LjRoot219]|uniref:FAD-binding protein n=1 Tax=Phenylobacterium sp. LjRoot219 TaxID=3342283 RepID=UPI003ECD7E07